jgi:hypothetical protein
VQPESKGIENPFQFSPTPCKNTPIQHRKNGAQSVRGFVPKNSKKNEKNGGDLEVGFRVFVEKMEKWGEMVAGGGW